MVLVMAMTFGVLAGCGKSDSQKDEVKTTGTASNADSEDKIKWPKKTIQLIVPFSAGGDTDFNARTLAKYLEKELGVSVVVSNVTGSGGSIAANQVKTAANDGYSVLYTHVALNISTAAKTIDYSVKDFDMGCIAGRSIGDAVLVRADSPWNTIEDMIEDSAKNPQKYTIAASTGATTHWVSIAINNAGAAFNVVDAGNASDRTVALLGGQVDVICNSLSTVQDYIDTNQFKVLAVANSERAPEYPDVPTLKESGVDCEFYCAYTTLFPKGTDPAIVEKFTKAVQEIVENNKEYAKEIKEAYMQQPYVRSTDESEKYWYDELDRLMKISDELSGK